MCVVMPNALTFWNCSMQQKADFHFHIRVLISHHTLMPDPEITYCVAVGSMCYPSCDLLPPID